MVLRFHHALYSKKAIEATMAVFASHARFALTEKDPYRELSIEVAGPQAGAPSDDEIAGEVANYVLALTVEEKRGP